MQNTSNKVLYKHEKGIGMSHLIGNVNDGVNVLVCYKDNMINHPDKIYIKNNQRGN